jgi:hypothetical protein
LTASLGSTILGLPMIIGKRSAPESKNPVRLKHDQNNRTLGYQVKLILHLCADLGSDSRYYQLDPNYRVILIGKDVGVENYHPTDPVHGIIANPVCTEFQTINGYRKVNDTEKGMFLVNHCIGIIKEANPEWWVMENPARGELRKFIGEPKHTYQPWQYGSPWTKHTALWGDFNMPEPTYHSWHDVPKIPELYTRPGRCKPNLAFLHKSAARFITEFDFSLHRIHTDADLRSMCSQGFAKAFKEANP